VIVQRARKRHDESTPSALPVAPPTPEAIQARAAAKRQQLWRAFVGDRDMLLQNQVRVRHLMTRDVLSVSPATSRDEVVKKFQACRVSHLLVYDGCRRLLGVISDRDMLKRQGNTAAEVMTATVVSVTPDTTISSAVSLLIERRISSLPVVENDVVCGVITTTDLLLTLQCALQMWLRASQTDPQSPATCEGSGLANREELEKFLDKMLAIRNAHGHEVTLVLAAYDGEALAGPRLMNATWLLVQHARESDLVGYLGENRFVIVMPYTETDAASQIAEAIQDSAIQEPLSGLRMTLHTAVIAPQDGEDTLAVLSRFESLLLQQA
jgi:CBS domain-containing protein